MCSRLCNRRKRCSLAPRQQVDLFRAIRAAFAEPGSTCVEPTLRREYMKLIASIAAKPELFGRPEKAHLDIYRVVGGAPGFGAQGGGPG